MRDTPRFSVGFPKRFRTVEGCLQYLFEMQCEHLQCPACGRTGSYYFHRHPSKLCYTCNCGRYHFFPLKGTIFAYSALPLPKWFYGVFLMSRKPAGATGKELERELAVSYATAWRMMRRILSARPPLAALRGGGSAAFHAYLRKAVG